MNITILDAIIIVLFIVGIIAGMKQGFIKSIVSLVGTILIFILSFYLKDYLAEILYDALPFFEFGGAVTFNILLYELISFIIILSVLILALKLILKVTGIIEKLLDATIILGFASKLLGGIVGFIESYVLIFIMLFILSQPFIATKYTMDSKIGSFILNKTPGLAQVISKTNNTVKEIYELTTVYSNDKIKFNYESLNILLKYDVVSVDTVKNLKEKEKLDFSGIDNLIKNYGG